MRRVQLEVEGSEIFGVKIFLSVGEARELGYELGENPYGKTDEMYDLYDELSELLNNDESLIRPERVSDDEPVDFSDEDYEHTSEGFDPNCPTCQEQTDKASWREQTDKASWRALFGF